MLILETTELISWSVLLISLFNLFILILNHLLRKRTTFPTIDVNVYSLPPYNEDEDETLIVIRNIGTSVAYNISTEITLSYSNEIIPLDIEKHYFLAMNESLKKYLKLPNPDNKKYFIEIIVHYSWKKHFASESIYTERKYYQELPEIF